MTPRKRKQGRLGRYLAEAMKAHGWSRDQLAVRSGVSRRTIDKYLSGERIDGTRETAAKFAEALGVTADEIPVGGGK